MARAILSLLKAISVLFLCLLYVIRVGLKSRQKTNNNWVVIVAFCHHFDWQEKLPLIITATVAIAVIT